MVTEAVYSQSILNFVEFSQNDLCVNDIVPLWIVDTKKERLAKKRNVSLESTFLSELIYSCQS